MKLFQIGSLAISLVAMGAAGGPGPGPKVSGQESGSLVRVIGLDGTDRIVQLEGAGCTESICSRVFLRGRAGNGSVLQPLFHSISAIRDTTSKDALFVMRDGTERRLELMHDFRVLYYFNPDGSRAKLDLAKVRTLEFLDKTR